MGECHASDAGGVDKRTLVFACADTTALQGIDEELKTASSSSQVPKMTFVWPLVGQYRCRPLGFYSAVEGRAGH